MILLKIFTCLPKKRQPRAAKPACSSYLPFGLRLLLLCCFSAAFLLAFALPRLSFAQQAEDFASSTPSSYGFGSAGEPAPDSQTWGPLVNVQKAVQPGSELNGAQLPPSPRPQDSSVNEWKAEKPAPKPKGQPVSDAWDLSAAKVTGNRTNQVLEAEGDVYLKRDEEYLKADYARYYASTGWVYLKGNVEVFFGKDKLTASEAEFNIANKTGWLKDGHVFMQGPHIYFSGQRINKHWGDMYTFRQAKITTCDGTLPAWSMQAEEAVVEIDGYARLWNTSFQVKDQSVAYSPYMILPAKKNRQTGFLIPEIKQSSQNGFTYNQPFFWAIDKSRDLTLNLEGMTKRGVMVGGEYWARPDLEDQLWMRMDWLSDAKTGSLFDDGLKRTNDQRFWLRGIYDGTIPNSRWKMKADLDYVSDQDFLREFRNDVNGFRKSRDTVRNLFGREFSPYTRNRISEGVVYRDWDRFTFASSVRYEQDPSLGHGNRGRSSDTIAQRLPEADIYLNKGRMFDALPLEVTGEAQAVNFFREMGTKGMRYDLFPRVSVPFATKYFTLEPGFGLRQTEYQTERKEYLPGDTGNNGGTSRTLPEFTLASYTELARVYPLDRTLETSRENLGKNEWVAMRHSIQPRVNYLRRADVNQADLPYYDYTDRISTRNEITYSLLNVVGMHREAVVLDKEKKPARVGTYYDFVRFNLESGYDIEEARRNWDTETYKRRPFMDVLTDLEVLPREYLSLRSRTWMSPYSGNVTRQNLSVTLSQSGVGSITTAYDMRNEPNEYWRWRKFVNERNLYLMHQGVISEQEARSSYYRNKVNMLHNILQLDYFAPISLRFDHWYNLDKSENMEYTVGLTYTHQCFIVSAEMYWDYQETSYGLTFALPGFWN